MQIKVNGVTISVEKSPARSSEASSNGVFLRALWTIGNPFINLIATGINRIVSLGTFKSVDEIKSSNKVINAVRSKVDNNTVTSLNEVKSSLHSVFVDVGYGDKKAESRTAKLYFIGWLLGIPLTKMKSGDNISDLNCNYKVTMMDLGDSKIPVCIAKLSFVRNTMDVSGVVGQSLCVINTFNKDASGKLKASLVGQCYLTDASSHLNGSVESFNIVPTGVGLEFVDDNF